MVAGETEDADLRDIAEVDPARACKLARKRVAERPEDEKAALLLRELARRLENVLLARSNAPSSIDSPLGDVMRLMKEGQLESAEIQLRRRLQIAPDDVEAMVMMAEIAARCDFFDEADTILAHALKTHPNSVDALLKRAKLKSHADLIHQRNQGDPSLEFVDQAISLDPKNAEAYALRSSILVRFRRFEESLDDYWKVLDLDPLNTAAWANFGTLLSSLGRLGDAVACLRTAAALNPQYGFAWWELANLKTSRLFESDRVEMEAMLESETLGDLDRAQIHFALATAFDQSSQFAEAAEHLCEGNRLKRPLHHHNSEETSADVSRSIEIFTREFFAERAGQGDQAPDPIFIVGMPRSGSTLVEQILSSHSAVEATGELFLILKLALEIDGQKRAPSWQETVEAMPSAELEMLGSRFIELSKHVRKSARRFFIDKNPANWRFIGLIASILPNAKIIDVRRDPLDCCFANFSQSFEQGVGYSYSQQDLGRFYGDYLRLMRHFDTELAGHVHHLIYEDLVDDLESSVRQLLDYLNLPFEDGCLRFFENERAVLTPSAQQVRRPINRSGIGRWRSYEPWLGELKTSLGFIIDDWRR